MSRMPAWWTRHASWWSDQQLYLRDRRLHGVLQYDEARHIAVWNGNFEAAGQLWPFGIVWGAGTPFFAPRFYPIGLYSCLHQLNDGSMCLLAPSSRPGEWRGVLDLGPWLEQATRWFEGYKNENWALDPQLWMYLAPQLPGPEYRRRLPPTMLIAIPPRWWNGLPRGVGIFHARLPRDRKGLGVILSFRPLGGKLHEWKAGHALVQGDYDDFRGIFGSPTGSSDRETRRFVEHETSRAVAQRKVLLTVDCMPLSATDLAWSFFDLTRFLAPFDLRLPIATQLENMAPPAFWPGIPVDPSTLEVRRRIGREDVVSARIAQTQFLLVGLGALGSEVAHLLAKEGAKQFFLVDGDVVLPGNVTRHRAGLNDVGRSKVDAMKRAILAINPDAEVHEHYGWIDELAPHLERKDNRPILGIGMTGDEGSEHLLDDFFTAMNMPCLHAWLERNGEVLRLARFVPGKDPTLRALSTSKVLPFVPPKLAEPVETCADLILPGSASNVHAAANFVARVALDLAAQRHDDHNHWLFAPNGMEDAEGTPTLRHRYGVASFDLRLPEGSA